MGFVEPKIEHIPYTIDSDLNEELYKGRYGIHFTLVELVRNYPVDEFVEERCSFKTFIAMADSEADAAAYVKKLEYDEIHNVPYYDEGHMRRYFGYEVI